MKTMFLRFCVLVVLLRSTAFGVSQEATVRTLQVVVLDASNGKPQENVTVEYFCTGPPENSQHKKVITKANGVVVSVACSEKQAIYISVFPADKKEQCGVGPVTLKEIIDKGVVTKPDADGGIWCPTKISASLKAAPGQVVMFVKRPTWWQSHFAG